MIFGQIGLEAGRPLGWRRAQLLGCSLGQGRAQAHLARLWRRSASSLFAYLSPARPRARQVRPRRLIGAQPVRPRARPARRGAVKVGLPLAGLRGGTASEQAGKRRANQSRRPTGSRPITRRRGRGPAARAAPRVALLGGRADPAGAIIGQARPRARGGSRRLVKIQSHSGPDTQVEGGGRRVLGAGRRPVGRAMIYRPRGHSAANCARRASPFALPPFDSQRNRPSSRLLVRRRREIDDF